MGLLFMILARIVSEATAHAQTPHPFEISNVIRIHYARLYKSQQRGQTLSIFQYTECQTLYIQKSITFGRGFKVVLC